MSNSSKRGLTSAEVAARRAISGLNVLPQAVVTGPFTILLRQFSSFLIFILIAAALVAAAIGERIDALAIGLVVVLNAALGFVQEWRAETALAALRSMLSPRAMVLRDGCECVIPARELVPGDLLLLEAGDSVPADARVTESVGLQVDESVLTGESLPQDKGPHSSKLYTGTAIVAGHAEAEVNAIGAETEFGQIVGMTGAADLRQSHLQMHLARLARQLGLAALVIATGIALLGIATGRAVTEMLLTGLSLAVAIVPEGLPAVVTITLALGAAAMARQNALARRLQAIETLGAASVICTDKTGTLTENKMTVTRVWTPTRAYDVTGTGYDPAGHIETDGTRVRASDDAGLAALLRVAMTCTHARLTHTPDGWTMTGAPTEGALITLGHKGWYPNPSRDAVLAEVPFTSERKRMSVLCEDGPERILLTKGAPEAVLDLCSALRCGPDIRQVTADDQAWIRAEYEAMANKGLRVIAFAERRRHDKEANPAIVEDEMTFLGLAGLIDPPRQEVHAAISQAKSAGIRVLMITGDSPVTARAIAEQVGMNINHTLTARDLEAIGAAELTDTLRADDVLFARTRPADKMRIVSALQSGDQIVAMTGDGVNDAPALKQADIGVAMGIRGTDVAREAADLVLLDDNFATIVTAIREGRRQFANIRKFVRYLLSSNAGEIVALVVNIAIGGPLIFLATQILWMNLVTDGVTAVALGLEKTEPDQMEHPPRPRNSPILGAAGIATICLFGLYTGLASLFIFTTMLDAGVELARTTAFTAMVVFEKISVFAFRSLHLPCTRIGWLSNPLLLVAFAATLGLQAAAVYWQPLQGLLHTVPIGQDEWILIGIFALPLLVVPEVAKWALSLLMQRSR